MTVMTLAKTTAADPFKCPSWCIENHDGDDPADTFHRSSRLDIEAPEGARPAGGRASAVLPTHLVVHSVDLSEASIAVGEYEEGFDLETVEQVDTYLASLTDYLFHVRELRDQLAAIQGRA